MTKDEKRLEAIDVELGKLTAKIEALVEEKKELQFRVHQTKVREMLAQQDTPDAKHYLEVNS